MCSKIFNNYTKNDILRNKIWKENAPTKIIQCVKNIKTIKMYCEKVYIDIVLRIL